MINNAVQKRPFDLLNRSVDKNIVVGIKGGKEFTGRMESFDVHMNIILVNASFKDGENKKEFKNIFLRGDSVIYISPVERLRYSAVKDGFLNIPCIAYGMSGVKLVVEALVAVFIIAIFAFSIFPALAKTTGQDMTLWIILLFVMAVGIIYSVIRSFSR